MASIAAAVVAYRTPLQPAELPEPGEQVTTETTDAALAGTLRDPAQEARTNELVPFVLTGQTDGPAIRPPGVNRVPMARHVTDLRPWAGDELVHSLGSHVEQRLGASIQPGDAGLGVPTFAPRRNTYRLPPEPADSTLFLGE